MARACLASFFQMHWRELERNRSSGSHFLGGVRIRSSVEREAWDFERERPGLGPNATKTGKDANQESSPKLPGAAAEGLSILGEKLRRSCWFMGSLIKKVNQMLNYPNEFHAS